VEALALDRVVIFEKRSRRRVALDARLGWTPGERQRARLGLGAGRLLALRAVCGRAGCRDRSGAGDTLRSAAVLLELELSAPRT